MTNNLSFTTSECQAFNWTQLNNLLLFTNVFDNGHIKIAFVLHHPYLKGSKTYHIGDDAIVNAIIQFITECNINFSVTII